VSPDPIAYQPAEIYRTRSNPANPAPTFLTIGAESGWNPKWVNDIGN